LKTAFQTGYCGFVVILGFNCCLLKPIVLKAPEIVKGWLRSLEILNHIGRIQDTVIFPKTKKDDFGSSPQLLF